jgi:hypothetical protein
MLERAMAVSQRCAKLARHTPKVGVSDSLWWERQAALGDANDKINEMVASIAPLAMGETLADMRDTLEKLREDLAEEDADRHAQRIAVIDLTLSRDSDGIAQ